MTASLQSGPEILIPNTGIAAASMPDKRYSAKVDFESKQCFVFYSELVCLYWACFLVLFCTPLFVPEQVSPRLANFADCQLRLCFVQRCGTHMQAKTSNGEEMNNQKLSQKDVFF